MTKTRTLRNGKKPAATGRRAGSKRDASGIVNRAPTDATATWAEVKMFLGPTSVPARAIRRAVEKAVEEEAARGQTRFARHKTTGSGQIKTREKTVGKAR